ncbi:hypothetical protein HDC90_001134 [Pedobacter sp. AK013]|uniref:hypothetical protein n=1 Tax=Pedobacter sp. AK013 TaxID=2723071 RepID=UPI001614C67B|nr:hypothetical protein [Pedobacter sp. AK013]MBB6236522.1 hypothetical protein [Pedobacter sp. AK013]
MEQWIISKPDGICEPTVVAADVKKDLPEILFEVNFGRFIVVWANQSDYKASEYGTEVEVKIYNAEGTKFRVGSAVNINK